MEDGLTVNYDDGDERTSGWQVRQEPGFRGLLQVTHRCQVEQGPPMTELQNIQFILEGKLGIQCVRLLRPPHGGIGGKGACRVTPAHRGQTMSLRKGSPQEKEKHTSLYLDRGSTKKDLISAQNTEAT